MNKSNFVCTFYWWLLKKTKTYFSVSFLFSLLICYLNNVIFFNIRNNFNSRNPGYGKIDWLFSKYNLNRESNPSWYISLIIILLLVCVLGQLILRFVNNIFERRYTLLVKSFIYDKVIAEYINNSYSDLDENYLRDSLFWDIPSLSNNIVKSVSGFFSVIFKIIFECYFLNFFLKTRSLEAQLKNFAFYFSLVGGFFLLLYLFLTWELQKKLDQEELLQKKDYYREIGFCIDNLISATDPEDKKSIAQKISQCNEISLKENKTLAFWESLLLLPKFLMPGLTLLFCFFYYFLVNPSLINSFNIYLMTLSINRLFWHFIKLLSIINDFRKTNNLVHKIF